jgi:predicted DNA-binding antitoxin AbrB/MazE fold protein
MEKEIKAEFEQFEKYNVFKPVPRIDLPNGEKVLTTTWAFKHKANGTGRGRLNARGCEQLEGEHFMADSVSSPVTNPATIR